jgi:hypothetical protein
MEQLNTKVGLLLEFATAADPKHGGEHTATIQRSMIGCAASPAFLPLGAVLSTVLCCELKRLRHVRLFHQFLLRSLCSASLPSTDCHLVTPIHIVALSLCHYRRCTFVGPSYSTTPHSTFCFALAVVPSSHNALPFCPHTHLPHGWYHSRDLRIKSGRAGCRRLAKSPPHPGPSLQWQPRSLWRLKLPPG